VLEEKEREFELGLEIARRSRPPRGERLPIARRLSRDEARAAELLGLPGKPRDPVGRAVGAQESRVKTVAQRERVAHRFSARWTASHSAGGTAMTSPSREIFLMVTSSESCMSRSGEMSSISHGVS